MLHWFWQTFSGVPGVAGLQASLIVNREVYRILGSILAEASIETAAA